MGEERAGGDVAADYVWALINPQLEPERGIENRSRLLNGEDGIPNNSMRDQVLRAARETFPHHVNILSHYGKFLSEEQRNWRGADECLMAAFELEPQNKAVLHML